MAEHRESLTVSVSVSYLLVFLAEDPLFNSQSCCSLVTVVVNDHIPILYNRQDALLNSPR